jgi:hypothetical protein
MITNLMNENTSIFNNTKLIAAPPHPSHLPVVEREEVRGKANQDK